MEFKTFIELNIPDYKNRRKLYEGECFVITGTDTDIDRWQKSLFPEALQNCLKKNDKMSNNNLAMCKISDRTRAICAFCKATCPTALDFSNCLGILNCKMMENFIEKYDYDEEGIKK